MVDMGTNNSPLVLPALALGALVDYNNQPFCFTGEHVFMHKVFFGITGQGKSKAIAGQFAQLFNAGLPCSVIDPHSELNDDILSTLIRNGYFRDPRAFSKLWYIRFKDEKNRFVPFNWLRQNFAHDQIALRFVEAIKRAFPELESSGSANLQNILLSAIVVLRECDLSLPALFPLLSNADYREQLLVRVRDPFVRSFFTDRYNSYSASLSESTLRRIFLLNFSPVLRNSLGSRDNLINFTRILDEKISVLFDLGGLDTDTQRLLGVLLTVGFEQAMLARAAPGAKKKKYGLFIDEFNQFLSHNTKSLANMLDLTRKFGLSLVLSAQQFAQTDAIKSSLQNCLICSFRLGSLDAKSAASSFIPIRPYIPVTPKSWWEHVVDGICGSGQVTLPPEQQKAAYWEMRLKELPKRHCLVHLDGSTVELQTIEVLPLVKQSLLNSVKEEYARRLLRYPPATSDMAPAQAYDAPTRPIRIHPVDARTPRQTEPQRQPQPPERGKTQRKNRSNEGAFPLYDDTDDDWQPYTEL